MVLLPLQAKALAANSNDASNFQQVEKSIKASFGGGFKTYEYISDKRLNYATIGHAGKRYLVASKNLYDWQVVSGNI